MPGGNSWGLLFAEHPVSLALAFRPLIYRTLKSFYKQILQGTKMYLRAKAWNCPSASRVIASPAWNIEHYQSQTHQVWKLLMQRLFEGYGMKEHLFRLCSQKLNSVPALLCLLRLGTTANSPCHLTGLISLIVWAVAGSCLLLTPLQWEQSEAGLAIQPAPRAPWTPLKMWGWKGFPWGTDGRDVAGLSAQPGGCSQSWHWSKQHTHSIFIWASSSPWVGEKKSSCEMFVKWLSTEWYLLVNQWGDGWFCIWVPCLLCCKPFTLLVPSQFFWPILGGFL